MPAESSGASAGAPLATAVSRAAASAAIGVRPRVQAVDILRGLVMVIMALDHTRDFVHAAAMSFQPEDLSRTTAAIFMTRWVTHICAPVFMFCAGLGAWLRADRTRARGELSRFLWTRGLWLVVLEFTVVRAAFFFGFRAPLVFLLVFWALGMSMIALAGLVHLPERMVLGVAVVMIAMHNLFDGIAPERFGGFAWAWRILHVQGLLSAGPPAVVVAYPLVPWIAVMAAGYCCGRMYRLAPERRRLLLLALGMVLTAGFLAVRAANVYGDPRPWSPQGNSVFTLLSFLNATKNPPSLAFLLMTLGPALLLLSWFDRLRLGDRHPLLVFGRVPLFFFVVHFVVIHVIAIAMTWLRYGAASFLFTAPPTLGTPRDVFPPDYGWGLWVVYLAWAAVVVALYPLCLWFMRLKARRREWWVSYL